MMHKHQFHSLHNAYEVGGTGNLELLTAELTIDFQPLLKGNDMLLVALKHYTHTGADE